MQNADDIIKREKKYLLQLYKRSEFVLERGEGVYLYDTAGKKYLDFVSGISVNMLGHRDKEVMQAMAEQAGRLIHCSNLYHTQPQVDLAELLVKNCFADKVFFCNSGAEAVEGALKFARKWGKQAFKKPKFEIVSTYQSFHGRTYGSLSATGQEEYQEPFKPMVPGFRFVKFNELSAMEQAVTDETCAILVEPVQGEGGIHPASADYLKGLRKICNNRGVLLIFDEIQCGLGRIGTVFAYQRFGVKPDILTLAKPIGGGLPMGVVLLKDNISQYILPGDHGTTFGGNPVVCNVALTVFKRLLEGDIIRNVNQTGAYLLERLDGLKKKHASIAEVRGLGLMVGVELKMSAGDVIKQCAARGVLVYKAGDKVLRLLPPLVIENKHVDILIETLDAVLAALPAGGGPHA
jgi:predicted acetylornithine/succinylornithine family transaminase